MSQTRPPLSQGTHVPPTHHSEPKAQSESRAHGPPLPASVPVPPASTSPPPESTSPPPESTSPPPESTSPPPESTPPPPASRGGPGPSSSPQPKRHTAATAP